MFLHRIASSGTANDLLLWQDADLWTCPVNPHLMCTWWNIYLFIK
jgi:hypothetical protein